jgi:hypothetical protein
VDVEALKRSFLDEAHPEAVLALIEQAKLKRERELERAKLNATQTAARETLLKQVRVMLARTATDTNNGVLPVYPIGHPSVISARAPRLLWCSGKLYRGHNRDRYPHVSLLLPRRSPLCDPWCGPWWCVQQEEKRVAAERAKAEEAEFMELERQRAIELRERDARERAAAAQRVVRIPRLCPECTREPLWPCPPSLPNHLSTLPPLPACL